MKDFVDPDPPPTILILFIYCKSQKWKNFDAAPALIPARKMMWIRLWFRFGITLIDNIS
jgi:hypothetical protein